MSITIAINLVVRYSQAKKSTIEMTSYEALYSRSCKSPLCWMETKDTLNLDLGMYSYVLCHAMVSRDLVAKGSYHLDILVHLRF